ncbi:malate synthase A [Aquipuribacter sp. SD81]|uniref:malate synthase A n=1 Tax=Aquipuribacter sp. SD81 TaxID=3127703 RepID=UPI003016A4F2
MTPFRTPASPADADADADAGATRVTLGSTRTGSTAEVQVLGPLRPGYERVLTPEALAFVGRLDQAFAERRCELLAARARRREEVAAGADLGFRTATRWIRTDPTWKVAPAAPGLVDRRVEITGPTDRKMAINALNSGARVWLADQEDATSPTWDNVVGGQLTLLDASLGELTWTSPEGREYRVTGDADGATPTVVVRPRGWHLPEKHLRVDGRPVAGALVDFGLYLFHCARLQLDAGRGPYFYLPKLESHLEARLWNDVFVRAQQMLGLPRGTIRATVLIETLPAAFEMEEILYELREHAAGLNAGRWDYVFSAIKTYGARGHDYLLPDRAEVTMTAPFMRAYTELLVATCHRRGAHAIGGMAAAIPDRRDPERTAQAVAKVRADKEREAADGFDGSWVAHPGLVDTCREVFDGVLGARPNQVHRHRPEVAVTAADLLDLASTGGEVTAAGLRTNVSVALHYLQAWLAGRGAVALHGLMEDAATAEISRSQVWQWCREGVHLADGPVVTPALVAQVLEEELAEARRQSPDEDTRQRFGDAAELLAEALLAERMPSFLTTRAYARHLVTLAEPVERVGVAAEADVADLTGCAQPAPAA